MLKTPSEHVGHLAEAPRTLRKCSPTTHDENNLIVLKFNITNNHSLCALLDSGASNNFIRSESLGRLPSKCFHEKRLPPSRLSVRLADGTTVHSNKRVVRLHYTYENKQFNDDFIELKMDNKFDIILGMPWLKSRCPIIDWANHTIILKDASKRSVIVSTISDDQLNIDHRSSNPPASKMHGDFVPSTLNVYDEEVLAPASEMQW